jgi:ubiquinone/menaquinone biosynthesis C-methylase UbiE
MKTEMKEQKNKWAGMAGDFEKRVHYVAGKRNIKVIQETLAAQLLCGDVLELGCGSGTYSSALASRANRLCVTDVSEQMLSVCRQRLGHLDNATIDRQDCFSLSYPEGTFDAVVMVNLLHVIPEPEKALRESRRVLKERGTLIVVSFTTAGMSFRHKIGMIYRYLRAFGKPPAAAKTLTPDGVRSMMESQGFTVQDARLLGITTKAVFVRATANGSA